jgi:hypothetical protein
MPDISYREAMRARIRRQLTEVEALVAVLDGSDSEEWLDAQRDAWNHAADLREQLEDLT